MESTQFNLIFTDCMVEFEDFHDCKSLSSLASVFFQLYMQPYGSPRPDSPTVHLYRVIASICVVIGVQQRASWSFTSGMFIVCIGSRDSFSTVNTDRSTTIRRYSS